jgi:hypothetical protein
MNIPPNAQQQIPLAWDSTPYGILKRFWNHSAKRLAMRSGDRDSFPHNDIHIGSGDTQPHAERYQISFPGLRNVKCKSSPSTKNKSHCTLLLVCVYSQTQNIVVDKTR